MFKQLFAATLFAAMATASLAEGPRVWLDTDHGPILLELDQVNAPITTQNFLSLVDQGFYTGLVFHRVVPGFVIQSGTFDVAGQRRESGTDFIPSERNNGLSNISGTIAMALPGNPPLVDNGQSAFFINAGDNSESLDANFTVFGKVAVGMATLEKINELTTYSNQTAFRPALIRRAVEVEPGGFPIMPLHTGSWFDPSNSGVGLNIEVSNNASTEEGPLVAAYWYDFREGRQIWLTGAQPFEYGATEVTVEMFTFEGEGGDFQSPPSQSERETWGTLTVRFESCSDAQFSYDSPTAGQGELSLTRLTLPDGSSCQNLD